MIGDWDKSYEELSAVPTLELPVIPASAKSRTGFMCKIDFDHELSKAPRGSTVYPDVDDLLEAHDCANECGIVEVEVRLIRIVKESEF